MNVIVECECGWSDTVPDAYYSELALALHQCVPDYAMGDDTCKACAVCVPHSYCTNRRAG